MTDDQSRTVDPITLQVLWNRLQGIPEEMGVHLRRTAFSQIIKYGDDFSTGVFTHDGRLIAQGRFEPAFLGCMPTVMDHVLENHVPLGEWEDGDLLVTNDPYVGAGHFPDIFTIEPVFYNERLVAFTATVAHHSDIGGAGPGSGPIDASTWYEEGLQIPPTKLYEHGERNEAVFDMILENVRDPESLIGDLDAQRAASNVGITRFKTLVDDHGIETVEPYMLEILERTEQKMRSSIADIPDGSYTFEDMMDGIDEPLPIRVTVNIDGTDLQLDFSGTADQLDDYALNSTRSFTLAESIYAIKAAVDPDTPNTDGSIRPLSLHVPDRSLLNPEPPAPLSKRAEVLNHIVSAIFGALQQAVPDRLPAAGAQKCSRSIEFQDEETGAYRSYLSDITFSAGGAWPDRDGYPAISGCQNIKNTPAEVIEAEYPVRVLQYALLPDTSGAGRHRGGNGTIRDLKFSSRAHIQSGAERFVVGPYGVAGGEAGTPGTMILNPDSEDEQTLTSKACFHVEDGDLLRTITPGGGGYGDPTDRAETEIKRDLRNGLISSDVARDTYGYSPE